jgi:hypothetical protein
MVGDCSKDTVFFFNYVVSLVTINVTDVPIRLTYIFGMVSYAGKSIHQFFRTLHL